MNLEWESEALETLEDVPMFVRSMIVEMAEQIVEGEGGTVVTNKRFKKMQDDYTPPSMMDRIDTSD